MANVITSADQGRPNLEAAPVPVRLKLSALWASVMFLYVYVDIIGFYKPGVVQDILQGRVWKFDITQTWALAALGLLVIPSLMVALSQLLPVRVARGTNIVAAALYVPVSIFNAAGATSWAYYFWLGAVIETVLLLLIVWYSWTWPRRLG